MKIVLKSMLVAGAICLAGVSTAAMADAATDKAKADAMAQWQKAHDHHHAQFKGGMIHKEHAAEHAKREAELNTLKAHIAACKTAAECAGHHKTAVAHHAHVDTHVAHTKAHLAKRADAHAAHKKADDHHKAILAKLHPKFHAEHKAIGENIKATHAKLATCANHAECAAHEKALHDHHAQLVALAAKKP